MRVPGAMAAARKGAAKAKAGSDTKATAKGLLEYEVASVRLGSPEPQPLPQPQP